jgi:hypothetical protein
MLEENYCFDAEMYADEVEIDERIEFREDQRGKFERLVSIRPILIYVIQ